jgi:hypothetical protein
MNKLIISLLAVFLIFSIQLKSQNDTIPQDDLLGSLTSDSSIQQKLLPDHMIITQRLLWGEKGLMRSFNAFELTPEKRAKELKLRRTMLVTHQILGVVTSLGMIGQGYVGSKLINGDQGIKDLHEGLAAGVNIGYFTTTSLALFSPPKMLNERKGYSSIKIHKYLAMIHFAGMIATNILADFTEGDIKMQKIHRAVAFTTFGAFLAAEVIIKF